MAAIIGYLMPTGELTGSLESTGELVGEITKPTGGSPYTGDYEVIPREELIRLLTNGLTMTDDLIIDAIPEDYVGSAVPRQSALSVSGNAITAPAGFYAEDLTETVQTGVEGIPTAVKGAVSNNSIEITPKVRNNEGYIPGSTLEGIPVSVSAGDLVSGTKTITSNVNSSNVTNYRYVRVDVQPNLQTKQHTPTETATTIQADAGHDGLSAVEIAGIPSNYVGSGVTRRSSLQVSGKTVKAQAGYYSDEVTATVSTATPGVPVAQMSAVSNHAVTITPKVTNPEGYITAGTTTGTPVSVSAGALVSGTRSFTANTTSADVTNYKYVDVSVSGGGGGKNVQVQHGTKRVAATAYTDVGYEITVAKAGTYNIYWAGWRSSTSGTNGAQVYVNGVASGSAVTTFDGTWTNVQNGSRTSVSLSQGDKVTLRARSRGTSYYMYIFFLSIEEV